MQQNICNISIFVQLKLALAMIYHTNQSVTFAKLASLYKCHCSRTFVIKQHFIPNGYSLF